MTEFDASVRRLLLFERQRQIAQITPGFNQHQRAFIDDDLLRWLARHMDRLRLGGDRCLYGFDFFGVGVDPIQARSLRYLRQLFHRQHKRLNFGQASRRWLCGVVLGRWLRMRWFDRDWR